MQILITGGAGFVGGNLAVYLAARGHSVCVMDNLVRRGAELNLLRLRDAGVQFHHGDIRCPEDYPSFEADVVLDCAAQPSAIDGYENPTFDFTNNTVSVLHTLEYCRNAGAGLIFWSTNKVYPAHAVHDRTIMETRTRYASSRPIDETTPLDGGDRSLYGASKVMADLMIQEWADAFQIPAIVNRFSCLAGPWQWGKSEQGWVAWWLIAHRLGLPLSYIGFKGKQVRDVLFIDDLCRLIEKQIASLVPGPQVFNVGGGPINAISLLECTDIVQDLTGCTVPMTTEEEARRADFCVYISDIHRVQKAFDWEPLTLVEGGLEAIDRWVVDNLDTLATLYDTPIPTKRRVVSFA